MTRPQVIVDSIRLSVVAYMAVVMILVEPALTIGGLTLVVLLTVLCGKEW